MVLQAPVIRPAVPGDREQIIQVSDQSWGGNDYIPLVLDDWLKQQGGELTVAELDNQVVGFSKLTVLTPVYGWLEGARVHPQWRRRGVAAALTRHHLDLGKRRGLRTVGMATHSDNGASQGVATRLGFRLAGTYSVYRGTPRGGKPPRVEQLSQVPESTGLVPVGFTFQPWENRLVDKWRKEGQLLGYGQAGMVLVRGRRPGRLNIPLLWGPPQDAAMLLAYAMCQGPEMERVSYSTKEDLYHRQLLAAGLELQQRKAVVFLAELE